MARNYTKWAWVNASVAVPGDPELDAAGLNHFENEIYKLDTQGKPYDSLTYYRPELLGINTQEIMVGGITDTVPVTQLSTGWTLTGCTIAAETGTWCHENGISFTESDNTAGTVHGYRTITSQNLATFYSGDASSTSDYIVSYVYIDDVTKVSTAAGDGILIALGTNTTNYYRKYHNTQGDGSALVTGWNTIYAKKSDYTAVGSPNWNAITYVQLGWDTLANASTKAVEFHTIRLVRTNATGTAPDDKQVSHDNGTTWVSRFIQNSWNFPVIFDRKHNDIAINMIGQSGIAINSLQLTEIPYYDGYYYTAMYNKLAGYTGSLTWHVDANNYIEMAVKNNVFTVNYCYAGSVTTLTKNLRTTLAAHSYSYFIFQKMGTKIRCRFELWGGNFLDTKIIGYTTAFTDDVAGHLYLGGTTSNQRSPLVEFIANQSTYI